MIISDNVKVRAWLHLQILVVTYVHHTPEDFSLASSMRLVHNLVSYLQGV